MKTHNLKLLSISAASGKIGYIFLINGKLMDWGLSVKATETPGLTKCKAEEWIQFYRPDIVVTEKIAKYSRKSKRTHKMIEAIKIAAGNMGVQHMEITREQGHANKYDEIEYLVELFPQIEGWAPDKRQAWDGEANDAIYFEALALAMKYREPPANLPVIN